MKFSFSVTFIAWALGTTVVSAGKQQRPWVQMITKASQRRPEGAIYFITNQPNENMVITASIEADGTVRLDRAVAAGGRGSHGLNAQGSIAGADPFNSQSPVAVSKKSNMLATLNAGSNTITLFSIDPRKPTNIVPLGYPVASGGEFPISVAFNPDGTRLCALNSGQVNGVACWSVDKTLGLVSMPNTTRYLGLNQTTPPVGPPNTPSQIAFSQDGSKLIATYKGIAANNVTGFLNVWDIAQDGSLSPKPTILLPGTSGATAFSLTPIPNQNAFVIADPGIGIDVVDLSGQNRQSTLAFPNERASCWSTYSAATNSYFAIDIGGAVVREVTLDGNLKPTLVQNYTLTAMSQPSDAETAIVRGTGYMYILAANATSVDIFNLQGGVGKAKLVQTLDIAGPAKAAGVTVTSNDLAGMAVYLTSS